MHLSSNQNQTPPRKNGFVSRSIGLKLLHNSKIVFDKLTKKMNQPVFPALRSRLQRKLMLLLLFIFAILVSADPSVTTPPPAFFELVRDKHRIQAKEFYKKYSEGSGLPIAASSHVA